MVQSNRLATVAQFAEKCNSGRKESEYTVYYSLLCIVLHSRRPIGAPMVTPAITKSANNKRVSNGPQRSGRRWPVLFFKFTLCGWPDVCALHT